MNLQKRIHAVADKREVRAERAFLKAVATMRERCPINDLADAIADRNVHRAVAIASRIAIEEALVPLSAIAQDTVMEGRKVR